MASFGDIAIGKYLASSTTYFTVTAQQSTVVDWPSGKVGNFPVGPVILCNFAPHTHQAVHCIWHRVKAGLYLVGLYLVGQSTAGSQDIKVTK